MLMEHDYLCINGDKPETYASFTQAAAMAEIRGEAEPGEVYGRPLSDFEEPPPVVLECMG